MSLINLPRELQYQIIDRLDPFSLESLSYTCWDMNKMTHLSDFYYDAYLLWIHRSEFLQLSVKYLPEGITLTNILAKDFKELLDTLNITPAYRLYRRPWNNLIRIAYGITNDYHVMDQYLRGDMLKMCRTLNYILWNYSVKRPRLEYLAYEQSYIQFRQITLEAL